jgi:hypothetical protein
LDVVLLEELVMATFICKGQWLAKQLADVADVL